MERKTSGQASPPARDTPLLRCRPTGGRGPLPVRHLFDLPRGRGPSQTPKFLSPGPPSPWLPALPIERLFYRFYGELAIPKAHPHQRAIRPCSSAARVQPRGCKGRSPLHEITLISPFPAGEGGRGDRGQESKLKAGSAGGKESKPPAGDNSGKAGQATPAQAHVLFPISHTRGQNFSTTCGETCGETRRMVRRLADAQTVFALLRGFSARFDRRRGVEKTARRPETTPPPAGQDSRTKTPEVTDRISAARSAGIRPPPNA